MKTLSLVTVVAMIVFVIAPAAAFAGCGDCKSVGCGEGCSTGGCAPVLQAECKWVDMEKNCWEVECKDVAIPPVKLPKLSACFKAICSGKTIGTLPESGNSGCSECTETGCTGECGSRTCGSSKCPTDSCSDGLMSKLFGRHACGRVRTISLLKSSKSKVRKQVVEWKIVGGSAGCVKSCTSGCTSGSCMPWN